MNFGISKKIRIGTRASQLAIKQTEEICQLLTPHLLPSQEIEIVRIKTSGDKIQDRSLAEIGGKGLFIKELEEFLIQNKIDLAVHSAKDVPPLLHDQTILSGFTKRLDVRDCFISKHFQSLKDLPIGAVIGTSSPRRRAILQNLRPDLQIIDFRGNVDTRLVKISQNQVDATIVAVCGLTRLSKKDEIKMVFETTEILPAGGQGGLVLQSRKDDKMIYELVQKISDVESQICIKAERAFLRYLGASCISPVAVLATKTGDVLNLETLILATDGSETYRTKSQGKFSLEEGVKLGMEAAVKTKKKAANILHKLGM